MSKNIELDLNCPVFQRDWLSLETRPANQLRGTLRKIVRMDWESFMKDSGANWEHIRDEGEVSIYSFRFSQKYRALATREGNILRILSLHVDHDSAYK